MKNKIPAIITDLDGVLIRGKSFIQHSLLGYIFFHKTKMKFDKKKKVYI